MTGRHKCLPLPPPRLHTIAVHACIPPPSPLICPSYPTPPPACPCPPPLGQVLLLEAYEQLENDVAKEIDRALAKQAEEVARLQRRVDFLQVGWSVGARGPHSCT